MKFCWATINVSDMEQSLKFYQEVIELPLNKRYPAGPGVEISFLGDGETQIELICNSNQKVPGEVEGISLGFKVDSLDEKLKLINDKGIKVTGGPFQPNPHVRFFFIKDPNGINIQFVENS